MNDHDHSYKLLFSHRDMVEDLLKGFVREDWVQQLEFSTLERVSGHYVSDDLREREDDIIWRVRWGEQWLYVYLLLESQSSVDRFMAVRVMTYLGLLYQDLIARRQLTEAGCLPPVLPVVLYNGKPRWTSAVDIADLVETVPGGLERYRPRLRYLLLDEGRYRDEELRPLRNLVAAVFRLENSRSPEDVLEVLNTLVDWLRTPEQAGLRRSITVWLKRVLLPRRVPRAAFPELADLQEVRAMLAERVQEWTKEWREQGLEQGRKEGELLILTRQLEHRFGPLSENYKRRLQETDADNLLKWSERILTAASIEEVFDD